MREVIKCSIEGCESTALSRGWCSKHYYRWRRNGDPEKVRGTTQCAEPGCSRVTVGQGWCELHYARYVRVPQRKQRLREAKADRLCAQCGGPIPVERRSGAAYCSRKCKERDAVATGRQREHSLRSYYRRQYGLELEQVEEMRRGGCAICGRDGGVGRHAQLHVDHDHATGAVRGMLCSECNVGLGKFADSVERLEAAVRYLRQGAGAGGPR